MTTAATPPSAMETFHSTFREALTHELEALVKDLRAAAGSIETSRDAAPTTPMIDDDPASPSPGNSASTAKHTANDANDAVSVSTMIRELVTRWSFVLTTYRAHVAAEDAVVLPALAARVNNVAHAYELEHEAEDALFDGITAALDRAMGSCGREGAAEKEEEGAGGGGGGGGGIDDGIATGKTETAAAKLPDALLTAVQDAARTAHAAKTALAQHLLKEAAHVVPLFNKHFTETEQRDLVSRFIRAIPSASVGPVLARGPSTGEQGPLRTLLASWLETGKRAGWGGYDDGALEDGGGGGHAAKRVKRVASEKDIAGVAAKPSPAPVGPIDHIFQFHEALRKELRRLEADVLALPPPADETNRASALRTLEGRFVFFWGVYRAHSRSEDELVFPALEAKEALHNVSHSYTLDHEHEAALFVELDQCLRELRQAAGLEEVAEVEDASGRGGGGGDDVSPESVRTKATVKHKTAEAPKSEPAPSASEASASSLKPKLDHAAVLEVERRLQGACVAVRTCLETHVAMEEAELWPLFESHFTVSEQARLVGLIIGRTGAEVLQSLLSWQRKALTEKEKAAMIGSMRDASRNTRRVLYTGSHTTPLAW